jgi:small nuclear ribonucleoprotein (snRNP)-like protein
MKRIITILVVLLPFLCIAQDKISVVKLKNGTELKGVIKSINPSDALIIDVSGIDFSIKMSDVTHIEAIDNIQDNISTEAETKTVVERQMVIKPDELRNYKGFLLEKGNNVYVWGENNLCGESGAEELKRLLKNDGFWNVVDNLQDAHFSINYCIKFKKRDQVVLTISSWRNGEAEILRIFSENNMEIPAKHVTIARDLYKDHIFPFEEKIRMGDISTKFWKKFTIK